MVTSRTTLTPRHWKCPICGKRCYYLVVDRYLERKLEVAVERGASEIVFRNDLSLYFSF